MSTTTINTHYGVNIAWTVYRNGYNAFVGTLTLDSVAYDISSRVFSAYIRTPNGTEDKLTLTQGSGITNGGAAGTLTIALTEAQLATLLRDRYFIVIEYTIDSKDYPLCQGFITISNETNPGTTTTSATIPVNIEGTVVSMAVTLGGMSSAEILTELGDTVRKSSFINVSTLAALQTSIDALAAGADVNIFFPAGNYSFTSPITISGKGRVKIMSEGAVFTNNLASTGALFDVDDCDHFNAFFIYVDMNGSAVQVDAFNIKDIYGTIGFLNVDVYNYGKDDQVGVKLENASEGATVQNYGLPGATFTSCNFYNEVTVTAPASFDYNSNSNYGIGIYAYDQAEYIKISNCSFVGIAIGTRLRSGANIMISNCQFVACLPKLASAYGYGVVHLESGGTNGGKVQISNCTFNHNWMYCIVSVYNNGRRPLTIIGNHFIANAFTTIYISNSASDRNIIQGNFFDRANLHTGAANDPVAAVTERYIYTVSSRNIIMNNTFLTGADVCVGSGSPANYNVVKDNNYETGITLSSLNGANNQVLTNLEI